jgi:hypothetical protein
MGLITSTFSYLQPNRLLDVIATREAAYMQVLAKYPLNATKFKLTLPR